jgi:hypothetical protein
MPAFATPLRLLLPVSLTFVDTAEVFNDVGIVDGDEDAEMVTERELDEDIVEDEKLDVELVNENVLATAFVLDVNVTLTGSSTTLPFGSSATSAGNRGKLPAWARRETSRMKRNRRAALGIGFLE